MKHPSPLPAGANFLPSKQVPGGTSALAVGAVIPSAHIGMGIPQETPLCLSQTEQAHNSYQLIKLLISCLSPSDLGLTPTLGDPPAGREEGNRGEKEGTRPGAGVSCFPGRRRNLLPGGFLILLLVVPGSRGAGQCPTVSPAAGTPREVALSNQECEAVPSTSKGSASRPAPCDSAREHRDSSEMIVGLELGTPGDRLGCRHRHSLWGMCTHPATWAGHCAKTQIDVGKGQP